MWADKNVDEVLEELGTRKSGLTNEEVNEKRVVYGENTLPKGSGFKTLRIFFNQFKSAIMIILFVAIAFSLIIGEMSNVVFIGAVIFINVLLGFIQEFTAEKSAEKLQQQISAKAKILRSGEIELVDSADIVVGDIILLESGDKIPADIRLIETSNFKVDESILSGESEGREKNSKTGVAYSSIMESTNMVFAGTIVLSGRATGVVVEVGLKTEIGKISNKLVQMKETPSPLVVRINRFVKQISLFFACLVLFLSVYLYIKGIHITDILFSVIALTVSAIPEGLSTAVTISLSLSSNRMAKKNVIVKNLNSVESLGSCTVIASDKTGTLTVNEQTAKLIVLPNDQKIKIKGEGYNVAGNVCVSRRDEFQKNQVDLIAMLGYFNNEAQVKFEDEKYSFMGDSIDVAFKVLGIKNGIKDEDFKILSKIPYESENRYSAIEYLYNSKKNITIKGSPETILEYCSKMLVDGEEKRLKVKHIIKQNESLARKGYRVIAIANKCTRRKLGDSIEGINDFVFLGFVAFIDPARPETIESVSFCKKSGVKVYMITGDHPLTALSIGRMLGIASSKKEIVTGNKLDEIMKLGEKKFDEFIKKIRICARVTPTQKLAIIESLKRQGEFVAVTGDGINDTLALKEANIGIAVGSGSDIAKEASDMIITDDKFSSITTGVKEGRMAYANIRNVIYLLLSTGFCEIVLYVLSIFTNLTFPLTAAQFLWLNLVTNGIQSNAFAFEKPMHHFSIEKVKKTNENIFNKLLISETLISGFFIGLVAFGIYFGLSTQTSFSIGKIRAIMVTLMIFFEDMQVLNCRNEYLSAFKVPLKNNWLLVFTVILSLCLQIVFLSVAPIRAFLGMEFITYKTIFNLFVVSLSIVAVMEIYKLILNRIVARKRAKQV